MSTDPDTIAFYQARAPHYVLKFGQAHSYQLDLFLDRLPPGGRVLELGCGGGQDAGRMAPRLKPMPRRRPGNGCQDQ